MHAANSELLLGSWPALQALLLALPRQIRHEVAQETSSFTSFPCTATTNLGADEGFWMIVSLLKWNLLEWQRCVRENEENPTGLAVFGFF